MQKSIQSKDSLFNYLPDPLQIINFLPFLTQIYKHCILSAFLRDYDKKNHRYFQVEFEPMTSCLPVQMS